MFHFQPITTTISQTRNEMVHTLWNIYKSTHSLATWKYLAESGYFMPYIVHTVDPFKHGLAHSGHYVDENH